MTSDFDADNAHDGEGADGQTAQGGWSAQQLIRLENEWRRLQRAFAYHPHVHVGPLGGDPPDQYEVEYRVRTVIRNENGELEYAQTCWVHIWLPPGFPYDPPLVRPVTDIFHPNVAPDGVHIAHIWTSADRTLVDVVMGVGALLTYQWCQPDGVVNQEAWEWMYANPQIFPLDAAADFAPEAGGEPLARICRLGPRTIEQVRAQLKQMCDSLVAADGAPGAQEVETFARRVRQGLSLFLEEDIPQEMRLPAGELDDFARELAGSTPLWEGIRAYRAAAERALAAIRAMREVRGGMAEQMRAVRQLRTFSPASHPTHLMRQLPPAPRLQLHEGNLAGLVQRGAALIEEARQVRSALAGLPALDAGGYSSPLRRRLEAEIRRAVELAGKASEELAAVLAELEAAAGEAAVYEKALHRAAAWREYADMLDRGAELCRRVLGWGPAGVGAVFVENAEGRFGPFELEQPLSLGRTVVAARNPSATAIEIIEADTGRVLARDVSGAAVLHLPHQTTNKPVRTTFELAGNCEEIAVQLDYLAGECERMLGHLAGDQPAPEGWLSSTLGELATEAAQRAVRAEHEAALKRWRMLRDDLRSLWPLKERMATFRMLERLAELVPRIQRRLSAAQAELKHTEERLSAIVAASNTDPETGRLLIPHKYAGQYTELLARRESAREEVAHARRLLDIAASDARARLGSTEKLGKADLPALQLLGQLPDEWVQMAGQLSDDEIAARIAELERCLGTALKPPNWPAQIERKQQPSPAQMAADAITDEPPADGAFGSLRRRPPDPRYILGEPPAGLGDDEPPGE